MDLTKKTVRNLSFNPFQMTGYERFGFTPKKDIKPMRAEYRPPKYNYVVEWQMEEEIRKPEIPGFL
ncbi:MAG TPA: hypothetical protein PLT53_13225 [Prolixibacteraceae bacterium]|jgi:hypothetical protein|nr:MAG: hypothetical protein BWX87_02686 [Bacteroidetes bacterium ADurb.Bin123]HNZ70173.1 hypothetical protein [Prolixibacteraceae bacterium]HPY29030.1 hypothetical protein [Prolixibacteraceae bacterium]